MLALLVVAETTKVRILVTVEMLWIYDAALPNSFFLRLWSYDLMLLYKYVYYYYYYYYTTRQLLHCCLHCDE